MSSGSVHVWAGAQTRLLPLRAFAADRQTGVDGVERVGLCVVRRVDGEEPVTVTIAFDDPSDVLNLAQRLQRLAFDLAREGR